MRAPALFDKLSAKLVLAVTLFMLLLLVTVISAVELGLKRLQNDATQLSAGVLTQQIRVDLQERATLEATISNDHFARAAALTRIAADYLTAAVTNDDQTPWDAGRFQTYPEGGLLFDANPQRVTDVIIPPYTRLDDNLWQRLGQSAVLDNIFPALLSQAPEAIAIYYQETNMAFRYYPAINVVQFAAGSPGLDPSNADYVLEKSPVAPGNDPQRLTAWDPPYADNLEQGLLITANTPVYFGDDYQGVVSIDLSLTQLVDRLQAIHPTPSSYAFIVDENGRLVAAATQGIPRLLHRTGGASPEPATDILGVSLVDSADSDLAAILPAMLRGDAGLAEAAIAGEPTLLSFAPLPDLGWSLGIVVPLAELTAPAELLAAQTAINAANILRLTLALISLFFLAALVGVILTNRRLTRPIADLVRGTAAITEGDLDVSIPVTTGDELGRLAASFNSMTAVLRHSRDSLYQQHAALQTEMAERQQAETALRQSEEQYRRALEQRVAERTQELTTLLEVSHHLTLTLPLSDLLQLIIERLRLVVPYTAAAIAVLDDDTLQPVAYEGPGAPAGETRLRDLGFIGSQLARSEPVVIQDVAEATPAAAVYRQWASTDRAEHDGEASQHPRAWLAVPLQLRGQLVGLLTVQHTQPGYFTPKHLDLALAFADQAAIAIENAQLYEQAQSLAAMQERQKLARELHDSVSQALYGIALGTRTARTLVTRADEQPLKTALGEPLDYTLSLAEAGLAEMRALIFELRPESLASEGLVAALEKQTDALRARYHLAVAADFGAEPDIALPAKTVLYRVAQEALHNIVKHAGASQVVVKLAADNGRLALIISDNGQGFDPSASFPGHLGLKSMRERVEGIGGDYTLESRPGRGTTITVTVPSTATASD